MKSVNKINKDEAIMKISQNPSDSQFKKMINQCSQSQCLLCGGAPSMVGIFSPDNSKEFGAASGRVKQFFYSICNDCLEADVWMGMVQDFFKSKSKSMKWR